MADGTTTPITEEIDQTGAADPSGKATEQKTFTQEQVDKIVQERLKRAKSEKPADYDELKAKAARLDEMEEAQKSELEKATEAASKATAEASDWQAKYEELQAQREREKAVRSAASEYDVDVDVLMRMGGDVDENAKFLQAKEAARPKFGSLSDGGEQKPPAKSLDEMLAEARNAEERIRIREEHNARIRSNR